MFWLPGGKQKMEFQLALVTLNCDHHTYATLHSAPVHSLLFARMDLKWWFSNLLTTFSLGSYTASNCFFLLHFSFLCHAEQALAAVDFRFMLRLNKLILYRIYQSAHYVSYLHPQNVKLESSLKKWQVHSPKIYCKEESFYLPFWYQDWYIFVWNTVFKVPFM